MKTTRHPSPLPATGLALVSLSLAMVLASLGSSIANVALPTLMLSLIHI